MLNSSIVFQLRFFLVSLLILLVQTTHAITHSDAIGLGQLLNQEVMKHVATLSQEVVEQCPQSQCMVIGVGRSPTLLMAYLQTQFNDYAWNFPLSDFRYGVKYEPLDSTQEQRFFDHFESYFPTPEVWGGRRVLLLDFGFSGESLVAANRMIQKYFAQKKVNILVSPWLIAARSSFELLEIHPDLKNGIALEVGHPMINHLEKELYDDYAEFGSYKIQESVIAKESHQQEEGYLALIEKMRSLLKEMETIGQSLTIEPSQRKHSLISVKIPNAFYKTSWHPRDLAEAHAVAPLAKWLPKETQALFYQLFFHSSEEIQAHLCAGLLHYAGGEREEGISRRAAQDYLRGCLQSKSTSVENATAGVLSEMSGYRYRLELFESSFDLIFSKYPLYQSIFLDALQHYQGSHAADYYAQIFLESDSRTIELAKKSLIFYSYRLEDRAGAKETLSFLKQLLRSSSPEVRLAAEDTFLPRKRVWDNSGESVEEFNVDLGLEISETSESSLQSPASPSGKKKPKISDEISPKKLEKWVKKIHRMIDRSPRSAHRTLKKSPSRSPRNKTRKIKRSLTRGFEWDEFESPEIEKEPREK